MAAWKYDSPCSNLALSSRKAHDGRMPMPSVCQHSDMLYTLVGTEKFWRDNLRSRWFLFF